MAAGQSQHPETDPLGPLALRFFLGLGQMAGATISAALLVAQGITAGTVLATVLTTLLTLFSLTRRWHASS